MTQPFRYFNSGVMLIDVANWKREQLTSRTLDFISRNRDLCQLPDEDGLNALLDGRFVSLSPIWNMNPRRPPFLALHAQHDPVIVHYSGPDKPWKRFGRGKPLRPDMQAYRLYQAFLASSPWPGWLAAQWTARDLVDCILSRQPPMTAAAQADYLARFANFLAGASFADVEQGLTVRVDGRLSLAR